MSYLPLINQVTQSIGGGVPSSILGTNYKLYRLNSNTAGSIISLNSLVSATFKMYFRDHQKASRQKIENTTFDLLVFDGVCDGTKLKVGDILVETGYESDGGIYCVAQQRPLSGNMLVRVESRSAIAEPQPGAGSDETQPTVGPVWVEGKYGGPTTPERYVLTLDHGLYEMRPFGEGTLASVPIGFQPLNRVRESKKQGIPTAYPHTMFLAYIPPTPGYIPAPLDILKSQNMDSFSIDQVYSSSGVGISGTVCIVTQMLT